MNKLFVPHRRKNILTGEWVLVSPQRTKRPWMGQVEPASEEPLTSYDPNCYLCPGNTRANGRENPHYNSIFVFENDFPALLENVKQEEYTGTQYFQKQSVSGICRVICFSPKHNLTLARMSEKEIEKVIETWTEQVEELGTKYRWVQIFENRGAIMGSSNPHPHGQVWATSWLPNEPNKEDMRQSEYFRENKSPLLLDYIREEKKENKRIVVENKDWVIVVPFWAVWPFETLIVPKRHVLRLTELNILEKYSLAKIIKKLLISYDKLFNISFPYSMGWHGAPNVLQSESESIIGRTEAYPYWQLHAHYYPPLLRSATIKKFLVGFEMLAEAQRDITAEEAANHLSKLMD